MGKWVREGLRFLDAARTFGRPWALVSRYRHLYFDRRFSPNEIRFFRLLDPSLDRSALDCFSSKEELLKLQCILNSPQLHNWTEDKIRFSILSTRFHLPVPHLIAAISKEKYDDSDIAIVEQVDDFLEFLRRTDERSLILKPARGGHGDGIARFVRVDDEWVDSKGEHLSRERIESMISLYGYTDWIAQQEVIGHRRLAQFSNTEALQTCRIVTFLGKNGSVDILAARLRLICSDGASDNFGYGSTGNIIAILDPETGRIDSAFAGSGSDPQLSRVDLHPRTKRELEGFRVPEWSSAKELAVRAAKAFAPLRTVGWDVAISTEGPVIIEGNARWDTLSGDPRMGEIYRRLAMECEGSDR